MALIAATMGAVYWFVYRRPYDLLRLYDLPLYDLLEYSRSAPSARWPLLGATVALLGLYVLGWRLALHYHGRMAWVAVLAATAAFGAILIWMYPVGAADLFDYIMHGRIFTVHGANPYLRVGSEFRSDPFFPYMGWKRLPSTYGPLWVLLSEAVARLAGDGIVNNVVAFKFVIGVFFFGCLGLVAAILREFASKRVLGGVTVLAWNPLALYETFGNGHNDVVMVFWVLSAVWLLHRRRYTLAILALVTGALVKYVPILLLPAAGVIALRDLPNARARLRLVLAAGMATMALLTVAYLPFWEGLQTLTILRREDLYTASLPAAAWAWLTPPWGEIAAEAFVSRVALCLTVLFSLWQAYVAWKDRSQHSFARASFWIIVFYLEFTCLWFQEWYTIWPVALAAILASDGSVLVALMLNIAGWLKALVFTPLWLWSRPQPAKLWWELRLGPASLLPSWLWLTAHVTAGKRRAGRRRPQRPATRRRGLRRAPGMRGV